jgi:hypothetical protein
MDGERVLDALLRTMQPELTPGQYVFVTVQQVPGDVDPVAWIREEEGIGLVQPRRMPIGTDWAPTSSPR